MFVLLVMAHATEDSIVTEETFVVSQAPHTRAFLLYIRLCTFPSVPVSEF